MMNLIDSLPDAHRRAVDAVRDALPGWRIALAGGAVRDIFAERMPNDLDFVVEGCPSNDHLAQVIQDRLGLERRTGFGGCSTHLADGVKVDVYCIQENVLRPCATIEELVGADGGCGGFTFDADCGAIDLAEPDELIDGGLVRVMRTGVFDLRHGRGLKTPPPAIVLSRAAAMVHRYGWQIDNALSEYVARHGNENGMLRAAAFATQRGQSYLTAAKIRELLCGA